MTLSASSEQLGKICAQIDQIKFGMLTTRDADGRLTSRPMTSQGFDKDDQLWFFTSDTTLCATSLREHPQVNISFVEPKDSFFVSIAGNAELVHDPVKARELWTPMVSAWFPKGLDDPHLALIKVQVEMVEYWDTHTNKMMQLYALAKATLTGRRPNEIQDHGRINLQ